MVIKLQDLRISSGVKFGTSGACRLLDNTDKIEDVICKLALKEVR